MTAFTLIKITESICGGCVQDHSDGFYWKNSLTYLFLKIVKVF